MKNSTAGKPEQISAPNGYMFFSYSPLGQRQVKTIGNNSQYYIHDATGNVMAVYNKVTQGGNLHLSIQERGIYGSSRLGINNRPISMSTPIPTTDRKSVV